MIPKRWNIWARWALQWSPAYHREFPSWVQKMRSQVEHERLAEWKNWESGEIKSSRFPRQAYKKEKSVWTGDLGEVQRGFCEYSAQYPSPHLSGNATEVQRQNYPRRLVPAHTGTCTRRLAGLPLLTQEWAQCPSSPAKLPSRINCEAVE
jgi:hypothetical protein